MSSPRRVPIHNAKQSESLEIGAWAAFIVGAVLSFYSGVGLLLTIGAIGLLVRVGIREKRDMHREMRRRLERIEDSIDLLRGDAG